MSRTDRIVEKAIKKTIQAMAEGGKDSVDIESLLLASRVTSSIEGVSNKFDSYSSQVLETYKKYNGCGTWGNVQTRALVDFRVAFIAGEGISVSAKNEVTAKWIEDFINDNFLNGSLFINCVKATEMAGQSIYNLKANKEDEKDTDPKIIVYLDPYRKDHEYTPKYKLFGARSSIEFTVLEGVEKKSKSIKDAVPVVTGGDDILSQGPTTRIGVALNDIENYDRAVKDIRRLNHYLARITPTFKTKDTKETRALTNWLGEMRWKIGQAFIGTAEFEYVTPSTGAHDNLKTELTTTVKNISAITGIPIHWLGHVDLMSNRSTAESLYETVKHATLIERVIHQEAIYNLILKAQEMYIDSGGDKQFNLVDKDFEVKLPLIDYSNFLERVRALSLAFSDNVISMFDYQSQLPGIDPMKSTEQIEEDKKKEIDLIVGGINDERNRSTNFNSESEE